MSLDLMVKDLVRAAVREELGDLLAKLKGATPTGGLMPVKAAAARAGVSPALLRKWRQAGRLREYHAGRKRLVKWEDVEALMAAPAQTAGPLATVDSIMERVSKRKAG